MDEAHILHAIHDSPLGVVMREVPWLFSICQTLHFIGLVVVFGAILLVDLRMLGFFKGTPVRAFMPLIPLALGGFVLNLATGIMFFSFDPVNYWHNKGFLLKLAALAAAGLNALWFAVVEQPRALATPEPAVIDRGAKISAGLSIGIWVAVMVFGRLIKVYTP